MEENWKYNGEDGLSPIFPLNAGTKAPAMNWKKDANQRPLIENSDMHNDLAFVPKANEVFLDADNEKVVKTIDTILTKLDIKTFSYKTTRGKHYLFKLDNKVYEESQLGSKAASIWEKIDIKGNDGKGYVQIKKDGKWRATPEDIINGFKNAPNLPAIFSIPRKYKINFEDYANGEGRDNTMYGWIPKLRLLGWDEKTFLEFASEVALINGDKETYAQTISWAKAKWKSSHDMGEVKDYTKEVEISPKQKKILGALKVSTTPAMKIIKLLEKEISTLEQLNNKGSKEELEGNLADIRKLKGEINDAKELHKQQKFTALKTGVNNFDILYDMIKDEFQLSYNVDDKQVWGVYRDRLQPVRKLDGIIASFFRVNNIKNIDPVVLNKINGGIIPHLVEKEMQPKDFVVSFKNVTLDIFKGKPTQDEDKYITPNQIPHRYIGLSKFDEKHKKAEEFLDSLMNRWAVNNADVVKEIYELIGLSMTSYMNEDKAYFLLGNASNGKSWFLNFLTKILGRHNVSNEDLSSISNNIFASSSLYGVKANINADISSSVINDPSTFKKIVSGDMIAAQFKGKDTFTFQPYATLIFGANNIPYAKDDGDSDAIDRRLKIIPFLNKFRSTSTKTKKKLEAQMMSEEVIEVAISKSIEALKVAIDKGFTNSKVSQDTFREYQKETNHIISFIDEVGVKNVQNLQDIYNKYHLWTKDNGYKAFGKVKFTKKFIKVARMFDINVSTITYGGTEHLLGEQ